MVQKIHPRGVIWVSSNRLVTCQKKNDHLAVQYEDVHGLTLKFKSWTDSKKVNPLTLSNEEKTWTLTVERHNPTKKWVIILLSGFEDWRWNEHSEKRRWKKISLKKGTLFPLQTHTWGKFVSKRSRAFIVGLKSSSWNYHFWLKTSPSL